MLADQQVLNQKELTKVISPKLLALALSTVAKTLEVEFLHYLIGIVSHSLRVKELRHVVLMTELKTSEQYDGDCILNYCVLLARHAEKSSEVISIPKLLQRVQRQRKEIESWSRALEK